jgi:tetratricopeptide (TPR) repeat protein
VIAASMTTYTLREIQAMLGISRSAISSLMAAGFVSPGRGPRREYRFTFQDVVMLRTAHSLREAQIPARKILRSLRRLRDTLPAELPLSGLRITAAGNELAVRAGDTQWQVDSGQLLLDFEVRPDGASVSILSKPQRAPREAATPQPPARGRPEEGVAKTATADDPTYWFERGAELEASNPAAAEAAYRQALACAPAFADAYLNLGCLLCDAGRCAEAIGLYRSALQHCPNEPLLHFNLAIALEDRGKPAEALACYEKCLDLSRDFSDAHYNAALLYEQFGQTSKAIKHFSAVRRLQKG